MTIFRVIAALVVGALAGGFVNMGLVIAGSVLVPPPPGVDTTSAESLATSIHLLEFQHYLTPFLAHALGTFVGALVGYLIAGTYKSAVAWTIGVLNLSGGIAACSMIPAPLAFMATDLLLAYLPMTWLAIRLGQYFQHQPRTPVAT